MKAKQNPPSTVLAITSMLTLTSIMLATGAVTADDTGAPRADSPRINLGRGLQPRFFSRARYDGDTGDYVGETKLIVNAFLDMDPPGPVAVSIRQRDRVVVETTCNARYVRDTSLTGVDAQAELWECATDFFTASLLRTDVPVDIVFATPGGQEFYRGTFPVMAYETLESRGSVEQRALRLDSLYGVGYVRQYANVVEFSYVTAHEDENAPADPWLRCNVNGGAWTRYDVRLSRGNNQNVHHRVFTNEGITESRIVTDFYNFTVNMPIAVPGRSQRPSAGGTLDGSWSCEFLSGSAPLLVRVFQFDVRDGYIQRHAIEAQVPAGRGAALTAIGFGGAAVPTVIDPALLRTNVAGIGLRGATAPVVSGLPTRATNPSFARSGSTSAPASARPRRGGGRR